MLRQIIQSLVHSPQSIVKTLCLCAVSAILSALPFWNPNLWILSWFGFVPLFLVIEGKSKNKAFLFAYLTGVIFWLGTIYWLTNVTAAGYIVLSLYLALYFGAFGLIVSSIKYPRMLRDRQVSSINLWFIPSAWVLLEYLRGYLLTGFPWALLGYSQYSNLPAIQIADISGVYGVSFLVMMGNVFFYKVISYKLEVTSDKKQKTLSMLRYFVLSILVFIAAISYGFYKLHLSLITHNLSLLRISVIQGNIPQELKWDREFNEEISGKYFRLTKQVLQDKPDLIIWPETAVQDYLIITNNRYANIEKAADFIKGINLPLLLGAVTVSGENFYNSAVLFSSGGEILTRYDKLHLVPFGEYIPLRKALPFLETVVPIGDFTAGKEYTIFQIPNPKSQIPNKSPNSNLEIKTKFSTLICFEDVFGDLARNFVKNGAEFLVNITNDAWFGNTSEPYQHLSASVFRAVENRCSVIRAANTGVSCFILPSGRVNSEVNSKGRGTFIDGYITDIVYPIIRGRFSIYNKYGDLFVLVCFVIAGCGIIIKLKSKYQKSKL